MPIKQSFTGVCLTGEDAKAFLEQTGMGDELGIDGSIFIKDETSLQKVQRTK